MTDFNTIKVDRVVCDQPITVCDVETDIPIRNPLYPGSTFDFQQSEVEVIISNCKLNIDNEANQFSIDLELLIAKHLLIVQNGDQNIPIELSFGKCFPGQVVTECRPNDIPPELLRRLRCQIFDVTAEETLRLNTAASTFDEKLCVTVIAKIVFEDQIPLPKPAPSSLVPQDVFDPLEILAGKIRDRIGNQLLKKQLLQQIVKVENLLLSGQILEAMIIVSFIANELQQVLDSSPSLRIPINLVLADLNILEQQLKAAF